MPATEQESELSASRRRRNRSKKSISPAIKFIIIAFVAATGYVAGVYNNQIISALGPIFGYHVSSDSIDLSSVQNTYRTLSANFDGTLNEEALVQGANRGLVAAAGDKHTVYMSPEEATEFDNSLVGNIGGGIGAEIGIRNDHVTVVRVLSDNPAEKAGLMAGDAILKVNDEATDGWSVIEAVNLIRGEEGTTVKLTIGRDGSSRDYSITRATIVDTSVKSRVDGKIGVLTISRFDNETGVLARRAAQGFIKEGVDGVVLDLRGNGGGYLMAAKDVAGLWLDSQIVVTEKTGDKVVDTVKSGNDAILSGMPTVVLVNPITASASEILAGSLQDYKVAKLVGEKTYGKGSVQKPLSLPGGALLKVTVASWYTPDGTSVTKHGITPDYVINLTQEDVNDGRDPQLDKAKSILGL